jgi:antirestriction protein ArdC
MAYRNHRNAASRPSIYQTVTDRIISSLKAGVIPWEKPWKTPRYAGGPFPRNFYTGKPYRGINVLLLWSSEYNSPFWLTFKQAQALKGNVRKGEHGTQIIFYKQLPEYAKNDGDSTGEDERVPFVLCHYTVFNVEQCDGLTLPEISQPAICAGRGRGRALRKHRHRMGEPPRSLSQQPHRVPRLLPAKHRFGPHARP